MKKFVFIGIVFISAISFSKENNFFIGNKISNGRTVFNYRYTYNGTKSNSKQKLYYFGTSINYGGTIKNVSIYSGLSYSLYQLKYNNLVFDDDFNGIGFNPDKNPRRNYSNINIPINIDYNINLHKQKLFFVIGIGGELCITVKNQYKSSERKINVELSSFRKASFAITARTGLLYDINKRFDVYAYFDFSHHVTKYLTNKTEPYPTYGNGGNYPFNVSGSLGFNVKFYKKSKHKEKTE